MQSIIIMTITLVATILKNLKSANIDVNFSAIIYVNIYRQYTQKQLKLNKGTLLWQNHST